MVIRTMAFFPALAALAMCFCNLSSNNNTAGPAATDVSDLKVPGGAVSGWLLNADADSFSVWTAADLDSDIDGGALEYTDRGVIKAADEHLIGPNGAVLGPHALFLDFGTEANAGAMHRYEVSKNSAYTRIAITGYDSTVAFGVANLGGITVYAYFKKFYFVLPFTGYSMKSQAVSDANLFLGFFKSRIL